MKKIYSKDESLCLYLKTNLFSSLDRVKNLLKSMTWKTHTFSSFEAWHSHPNITDIDLTARACACACVSCVYSSATYKWSRCFFPLHFIPSSTVRLCWESAESISVGLTGSEGLSYVGGACELLQQQREHFVSSNSWEATAEDKDCWLMREIIYSEAAGNLKSWAIFRG